MSRDPLCEEFDAELATAERELVERARRFGGSHVAPHAARWARDGVFPLDAIRQACAENLAAIELAPAWGGLGMRFSAKLRVCEELARHDFGFAFSLVNHHNATLRITRANKPLADRLVPRMLSGELIGCSGYTEPGHGSDLAALETTARRVDGGWRLDGAKAWTTNAAVASVALVLAQCDPTAGNVGIATFVVEADQGGFVRETPYVVEGASAIGTGGFRLEDYFAPDEALLDPPGEAFRHSLAGINGARCYVAAMCAGMLDAAIRQAMTYGAKRHAFGQPVVEFQGVRWSLVDADADLAALRLLAYRAARLIDAGSPAEEAAARAKKFAGDRTLNHLAACIQAMGAAGLRADLPLMRHLAACKIACFTDGTTEIMNERLGKLLVRRHGMS